MKQQNIVGYIRFSTIDQKKGYGTDIQRREIEQFAATRGWRLNAFYIDEALSGAEKNRADFDRLLQDCRAGRITVVIVASLCRFARSVRFAENFFHELGKRGVTVCFADLPYYNGDDDKDVMRRQLDEVWAEYDRKRIIKRLKDGREARARSGKLGGGNLPYGYVRLETLEGGRRAKRIETNEDEADVIRSIFALDGQGRTTTQIANTLNEQGSRRRNGEPWTARQVRKIVTRRALYAEGVVKYGNSTGMNGAWIVVR
jgi:DNA invertase Pin-like site-specific DNA recombinase